MGKEVEEDSVMHLQRLRIAPPRCSRPTHTLFEELRILAQRGLDRRLPAWEMLYFDLPPLIDNPARDEVIIIHVHWPYRAEAGILAQ